MYNAAEGKADQKIKETFSLVAMLVSTIALGLLVWGTVARYGLTLPYLCVYLLWLGISIKATRLYMFLTPRRRYGTVTAIKDFKETQYTANGGAGRLYGRRSAPITECTITVTFDSGREGDFVFVYKGDLKTLKIGDRVGIFRFLRMPVHGD